MYSKFDLLYYFYQRFVKIVFPLNSKETTTIVEKNIPKNRPITFTPTYRNALIDTIILVVKNAKPQVNFWARTDIFFEKISNKTLRFLRIIPVYRIRNGVENLYKNSAIFEKYGRLLEKNIPICRLFKAKYNLTQYSLPIQKEIPIIELTTESFNVKDLNTNIIPIFFSFSKRDAFLSPPTITYGEQIKVRDHLKHNKKNKSRAINKFGQKLENSMQKLEVERLTKIRCDNCLKRIKIIGKKVELEKISNSMDYSEWKSSIKLQSL